MQSIDGYVATDLPFGPGIVVKLAPLGPIFLH